MKKNFQFLLAVILIVFSQYNFSSIVAYESDGPNFIDQSLVPNKIVETAQKLVDAYNERDPKVLATVINFKVLGELAAVDVFDNQKERRSFAQGIEDAGTILLSNFTTQIEQADGYVTLLGFIQENNNYIAQIRFDLGDFGTDYQELIFEKNHAGETYVVDWYQLSTDQRISKTFGITAKLITQPSENLLKKLFGTKEINQSLLEKFRRLGKAKQTGDLAKANEIYEEFPPSIKYSRIMLNVAINLSNLMQDDNLYKQRLSELAKHHSNDPSSAFLLLDHYLFQENLEKALSNLNVMEKRVGRDGFTTFIKANIYHALADDTRKAIALYKDAIELEPSYEPPYQTLSALYIQDSKFLEAVEVMKKLEKQFDIQYSADDFFDNEEIQLFKESNAFKEWMGSR